MAQRFAQAQQYEREWQATTNRTRTVPRSAVKSGVADTLLHALRAHGASEIFGIPGDYALPFYKVAEESGILPLYTLSHEPAVGFAADASARIRSAISVAAVTYGAGALNMVNAIASAYAEKSPVVVVSGAPGKAEASHGLMLHHQAKTLDSQYRIYAEITCDQARLDDAQRAPADIARVLRSAREQSRPVYIELPRDMVAVACAAVEPLAPTPVDWQAAAASADETLARIAAARSPVLMIDVDVRRFGLEAKVSALAGRLGLPVVTTMLGRGLLADSATPPLDAYRGPAGNKAISQLVEQSDCLVMVGVIASDTNFKLWPRPFDVREHILAAEGQVRIGNRMACQVPLSVWLDCLLQQAPERKHAMLPARQTHPRGLVADDAPIASLDIATAINDLMDAHGAMPIAADMGDCFFTAFDIEHTAFVATGYYATMGFGVPAGLALQAASGRRPLVLVGDGAFQMTGWELGNCRRYGWDPIVLVFNNASWEMLHAFQPESKFNKLDDWHFAELAQALGGEGRRVHTRAELAAALAHAVMTRGKFQLIEVMLPSGSLSSTLERFVAGVRRCVTPAV